MTPAALRTSLAGVGYVADDALCTALHLARELGRPLLLEGEAGVGKTEIARTLASVLDTRLIRLQCYEGLDAQHALYDWDYRRQLLAIQLSRDAHTNAGAEADIARASDALYDERFLVRRPLLEAIASPEPVVLLIDEIDRADEAFEALLLEVLSDFQVSIPELGTIEARTRPVVILTSNGVRELSDALRRRCLYHYLEYPDEAKERDIVRARLPEVDTELVIDAVRVVQALRERGMRKTPGIAETLDWTASLVRLGVRRLDADPDTVAASLTALVKTREDHALLDREERGVAGVVAAALSPTPTPASR